VTEKGIDATRVSVATNAVNGQNVNDYLVPVGASFAADVAGTTPEDETAVKPEARKSLAEKCMAKKSSAQRTTKKWWRGKPCGRRSSLPCVSKETLCSS
jgi:hypothetical protein